MPSNRTKQILRAERDKIVRMQPVVKKELPAEIPLLVQFAPIFNQLSKALLAIASKPQVAPVAEVKVSVPEQAVPDVKVRVDAALPTDIEIPVIDYSKDMRLLINAVNVLTIAVKQRPTTWETVRNSRGLITSIKGR